jgi:hypothetical protein
VYKTTFEKIHEVIITVAIIVGFGEVILGVLSIMIPFLENILFSRFNTLIMVYGFALFIVYSVIRFLLLIIKSLNKNNLSFSILPTREIRLFLEAINNYEYELDKYYSAKDKEFEPTMIYHLTKDRLISFIKKSRKFYIKKLKSKEIPFQILLYRTIFFFYKKEISNYSNWTFESKGCRMIINHALNMLESLGDTDKESSKQILKQIDEEISDLR